MVVILIVPAQSELYRSIPDNSYSSEGPIEDTLEFYILSVYKERDRVCYRERDGGGIYLYV